LIALATPGLDGRLGAYALRVLLAVLGAVAVVWMVAERLGQRYVFLAPIGLLLAATRHLLGRWCRRCPGTLIYLSILLVTFSQQLALSDRLSAAIVKQSSTNVHLLGNRPFDVLTTSAFWFDDQGFAAVRSIIVFAIVMSLVEIVVGTGRWLITVVAGHVGASVLVGVGLWFGIRQHWFNPRLGRASDVGISYALVAAAALLLVSLRGRLRVAVTTAAVLSFLAMVGLQPSFTDIGHGLAAAIGLVCYVAFGRRPFPIAARIRSARRWHLRLARVSVLGSSVVGRLARSRQ
jgi:hypothetical protein